MGYQLDELVTRGDRGVDVLVSENLPAHVRNPTLDTRLLRNAAHGRGGVVASSEDNLVEAMDLADRLGNELPNQGLVLLAIGIDPDILRHDGEGLFEVGDVRQFTCR